MAENKPIEIRYYRPMDDDAFVFTAKIGVIDKTSQAPVPFTATEAYFHISENERVKLELSLGNGLLWDDELKAITVFIRNSQMRFVRTDSEMTYSLYVKWDNGLADTIREGTVTAVKVD